MILAWGCNAKNDFGCERHFLHHFRAQPPGPAQAEEKIGIRVSSGQGAQICPFAHIPL